jgi:hypothetical protein
MKFQIKTIYVIDAETVDAALRAWREHPFMDVSEMTIGELVAIDRKEHPKTLADKVVATTTAMVKDAAVQAGVIEKTPNCPDHQVAMQKRESKYPNGKPYWSCPVKLDDGKYCRAKPK